MIKLTDLLKEALTEVSVEQLKTQFVDSGKISQEDFNGVAGHLKKTLEELNVENQDIDTIIGVVAPLSEHIVSK